MLTVTVEAQCPKCEKPVTATLRPTTEWVGAISYTLCPGCSCKTKLFINDFTYFGDRPDPVSRICCIKCDSNNIVTLNLAARLLRVKHKCRGCEVEHHAVLHSAPPETKEQGRGG